MGPTGRQTPAELQQVEAERQRINALLDAQDTRYRESLWGQQIVPNGPLLTGRSQPIDITGYNPLSYLNLYGTPTTTTSLGVQTAPSTVMLNGGATNQPIRSETTPVAVAPVDKPRSNDPVALTPAAPVNTATVSARPQLTPNVQVNNSFDYNRATPCEIMPNGQCRESTNPNDVFLKGYMANMNKNGGESLGDVARRGAFYGRTVEQQLGAEQSDNDKLAYANALNSPEAMAEVTRLMKGGMSLDTAKSVVSDNVLQQLGSHRARALYALPKAEQALKAQQDLTLGSSFATGTPATVSDYLGLMSSGVSSVNPATGTATVGGSTFNNLTQPQLGDLYGFGSSTAGALNTRNLGTLAAVNTQTAEATKQAQKDASAMQMQKMRTDAQIKLAQIAAQAKVFNATGRGGSPEMAQLKLEAQKIDNQVRELELQDTLSRVSGSDTGGK